MLPVGPTAVMAVLLDSDLHQHILSFLSAESLLCTIRVCRGWARTASNDALWWPLCMQLWKGKMLVPQRFTKASISTDAENMRAIDAYFGSLRDGQRNQLTEEELLGCHWQLTFQFDHRVINMQEEDLSDLNQNDSIETATFRADGTFVSSVAGAPSSTRLLRWQLSSPHIVSPGHNSSVTPGLHEEGLGSATCSRSVVRIGAYPLLKVRRIPETWGWAMCNRFVEIRTYSPSSLLSAGR